MPRDLGIAVETFRKQCKLFELLNEPGRLRMMEAAAAVSFAPGEKIIQEGEEGIAMFVIKSGSVKVSVEALQGEATVAHLGHGAVIGEIAVVCGQPRSATVTAEEPTEAWLFTKTEIDTILDDYPLVRQVLAKLGLRRSEMTLEKMLEPVKEPVKEEE